MNGHFVSFGTGPMKPKHDCDTPSKCLWYGRLTHRDHFYTGTVWQCDECEANWKCVGDSNDYGHEHEGLIWVYQWGTSRRQPAYLKHLTNTPAPYGRFERSRA